MSRPSDYLIEKLDPSRHDRAGFSCESEDLTRFLRERARKEMEAGASACFVLVEKAQPFSIQGYYTLSQASVILRALPQDLGRKLPRYPELGATLIGRLARAIHQKGNGLGGLLLTDALRRSLRLSGQAGAVVVVTDPKDAHARGFYAKHGFRDLDDRRMFMSMASVRAMIPPEKAD